ncbi:MAG: DNA repair protein RecO [Bacteroidota bacterium]|nr:DNA repair protein RecO [Bacteroidota bacterium]
MLVKSKGIVIKTTRFSETSVIAKIYTDSHGMLSFHIPGVHSKRASIKPSFLQALQILDMNIYFNENKNLHKIKEVKSELLNNNIHFDIKRLSVAVIISELIYKTIKEEEPNEYLFNFLLKSIKLLDEKAENIPDFLLIFIVQLTKYLGFSPTNNFSTKNVFFNLSEGMFSPTKSKENETIKMPESKWFGIVIDTPIGSVGKNKIPRAVRMELLQKMIVYYQIHISNFQDLKSFDIFTNIFNEQE